MINWVNGWKMFNIHLGALLHPPKQHLLFNQQWEKAHTITGRGSKHRKFKEIKFSFAGAKLVQAR